MAVLVRPWTSSFQKRGSNEIFLGDVVGIGISMLTYGDSLRFALNVDKTILSNQSKVDEFCAYIEEELRSLSQSTNHVIPKLTNWEFPRMILTTRLTSFAFLQTKSSDENQNKISSSGDAAASAQAQLRLRSVS